jgi:hypothetical protein
MPNAARHEFFTEVLDESSWAFVVALLVGFLRGRGVEKVTAEYGFVLGRDLRGGITPENCTVPLDELEALIEGRGDVPNWFCAQYCGVTQEDESLDDSVEEEFASCCGGGRPGRHFSG